MENNLILKEEYEISDSEILYNSALDYIEYFWGWTGRPPGFDGWFKEKNLAEEKAKEIWEKAMQKISTYFIQTNI